MYKSLLWIIIFKLIIFKKIHKDKYLYITILDYLVIKMTNGVVKFFNNVKRFGFISGEDGKEYFVHETGLKEGTMIKEGDKVSFKVVEGDKGPKAEEVEKVE